MTQSNFDEDKININNIPNQIKPSLWRKFINFISILSTSLVKNKYIAYIIIVSFPLFCAFLIYLMPYQPSIPHVSSLKSITGKFDYTTSNANKHYGEYLIDGKKFNCAQILRSYPFDNCFISDEVKAFKEQIVEAKWYNQQMGFGYKPILVEMTFDGDIQIMGIQDTQKLLNKLYKKNQEIFNLLVPSIFIVYFGTLFLGLYLLYKKEQKFSLGDKHVKE